MQARLYLIKGDFHLRDHEYSPADSNSQAVGSDIFITAVEKSDLITKVQ